VRVCPQVRATLGGSRAAAAAAAEAAAAQAVASGVGDPAAAAAAAARASLAAAGYGSSSSGSSSISERNGLSQPVALPAELSKAVQAALKQPELREPKGGLDGNAWCR
jgi:hypothetical protein